MTRPDTPTDQRCRRCVEAQMPGLADYARSHPQLEESPPEEALRILPGMLRFFVIIAMCFGVLFSFVLYPEDGLYGIIHGFQLAFFLAAIAGLIQGAGMAWVVKKAAPTVIVQQGIATISRPGHKLMSRQKMPLEKMQWRIGKARQDSMLRGSLISNREVLILQCATGAWWFKMTFKAACGWTDETRERWTAFLTLAGVPQGLKHPRLGR